MIHQVDLTEADTLPVPDWNGIALCGEFRSGKTTLARAIEDADFALFPFKRMSFAAALKDEVAQACGSPDPDLVHRYRSEMDNPAIKSKWRTILQWWGTEFRRQMCDENYWVNRLIDNIDFDGMVGDNYIYIVDDCRFNNEYAVLKANKFLFVRLDPNPAWHTGTYAQRSHASENEWRDWEFTLTLPWSSVEDRVAAIREFCQRETA